MKDVVAPHGTGEFVAGIAARVSDWPCVTDDDYRNGGRLFAIGTHEFGHVHRSGLVDIEFAHPLRDRLIVDGYTDAHHLHPHAGWTSFRVVDTDGVDHAVWLLWVSYLATLIETAHTHVARTALADVDVDAELAALPVTVSAELEERWQRVVA
ncbi:luciferase family protein [Haloarchaeobius sp. DFWS5]|uniref:luciferase domain-containing protein n=1 Tax=Haloarchaeobius sp. DFWS5 TaxID=3446114 RepID=UPI003EB7DF2B